MRVATRLEIVSEIKLPKKSQKILKTLEKEWNHIVNMLAMTLGVTLQYAQLFWAPGNSDLL